MSTRVSIGKAKPSLCKQASKGKTHIITVHDEPVAQFGPVASRSMELTEQWRERRRKILLNPKGKKRSEIADLMREGRKCSFVMDASAANLRRVNLLRERGGGRILGFR